MPLWGASKDIARRLLMLAGGAGGIGAILRAPLGGALFVSEVIYGSTALAATAVVPCFISSITAYAVFATIYGQGLAFHTPPGLVFDRISELPLYLLFAVVCGVVGHFYVMVFYGLRNRFFGKLPIGNSSHYQGFAVARKLAWPWGIRN